MPGPADFDLRADATWASRHPALFNGLPANSPIPPGTYWALNLGSGFDGTAGIEVPYLTGLMSPPSGYSYAVGIQMRKSVLPTLPSVAITMNGTAVYGGSWPPSDPSSFWYLGFGVTNAQYAAEGIRLNIVVNATSSPVALDLNFMQIDVRLTGAPPPPLPTPGGHKPGWHVGVIAMAGRIVGG